MSINTSVSLTNELRDHLTRFKDIIGMSSAEYIRCLILADTMKPMTIEEAKNIQVAAKMLKDGNLTTIQSFVKVFKGSTKEALVPKRTEVKVEAPKPEEQEKIIAEVEATVSNPLPSRHI